MPPPLSTRRTLFWLGLGALLLTAAGITGRSIVRAKTFHTPVAAYLIPIDNVARIQPSWWYPVRLTTPCALHSGESLTVPSGTTLSLLHAESGVTEPITGPTRLLLLQKRPGELNSLISPLAEVIADARTKAAPGSAIIVTSPVSETRYLNPLLTWTTREGINYDVAVTDAADSNVPPRLAVNIRPPIALADLESPQRRQLGVDRNYIIVVRETGAPALGGVARVLTTTDAQVENKIPTSPDALIAEAAAALAKAPRRTGDAWLALSRLPPDWARSELGVRLRLCVASELGLTDEQKRTLADAAHLR